MKLWLSPKKARYHLLANKAVYTTQVPFEINPLSKPEADHFFKKKEQKMV